MSNDSRSSKTSANSSQLWQGRSTGQVGEITIAMGESISLDIELWREDIDGSLAHARMLARAGILSREDLSAIEEGLARIATEIEAGEMELRPELEDIHTHIETRLTELIGEAGKRLHTARSRNDQIATDTHLYVQRRSRQIAAGIERLLETLLRRATEQQHTILPGYTHLQVAQPVRLSHHLLAHFWSFRRDVDRFFQAAKTAAVLPLGSGAMAGVNYATDREFLRRELGFDSVAPNSMDAVASRDHIAEFLFAASLFAVHASRLAEEIILWNSQEFSFISLPDELTTGSSIMPQKKNPDLAELSRGKTGRVIGNLLNILINLKGLPFTYNRDLQEDRQPLLDSAREVVLICEAMRSMIDSMEFRAERMQLSLERGYATATDLADALVNELDVPFREAHHISGRLVARAVELGETFPELSREERAAVDSRLGDDDFFYRATSLAASTDKKISSGGTALQRQSEQLATAADELKALRARAWPTASDGSS